MAEKFVLQEYAPAFVVVNRKNNIIYIGGRTGKFLEPAPGESSDNIISMAREGLASDLAIALNNVMTSTEKNVCCPNVKVKTNGNYTHINLKVQTLDENHFLVIFDELPKLQNFSLAPDQEMSEKFRPEYEELKTKLIRTEKYIQSLKEEMKHSTEQLEAANEEMQSINEELQSTNEELETTKEELQSMNEELQTVNSELQVRVDDLSKVSNDLDNLLSASGIPTIFLDLELKILRITPNATKIVNLTPKDIGRYLGDFTHSIINVKNLVEDALSVTHTLQPREKEVKTEDGHWLQLRTQVYRTSNNAVGGTVLTFHRHYRNEKK